MPNSISTPTSKSIFRAVLHPHRSLSQNGFLIVMLFLGIVSFIAGMAFLLMGAWPVFGFFGLDVLAVYVAFKLNYRDAKAHEIIDISPERMELTMVTAKGASQTIEFNPYWVRVGLREQPDGRASMVLTSHGREVAFGHVLNHDERRDFARVLGGVLADVRSRGPMPDETAMKPT
jgi:uncharacterized membrane protein